MRNEEVSEEVLKRAYENSSTPFVSWAKKAPIVEGVAESVGVKETAVETEIQFLGEDGYLNEDPKTVQLAPRSAEELDGMGATDIDAGLQESILEQLFEHKVEADTDARMDPGALVESLDAEAEAVHENVRYLDTAQMVEITSGIGEGYHTVEITAIGRRQIE
jgi:hypothetical protein